MNRVLNCHENCHNANILKTIFYMLKGKEKYQFLNNDKKLKIQLLMGILLLIHHITEPGTFDLCLQCKDISHQVVVYCLMNNN